ncbi:MAG TPA: MoaD/ThiS family protein [Longilinea sp.]|nr:MoaD/ThiS family protein [Longilinea sp.]
MPVTLVYRKQEFQLEGTITVKEALQELDLSPASHLITRDGELLNDLEPLRNGEVVKIVPAISGG